MGAGHTDYPFDISRSLAASQFLDLISFRYVPNRVEHTSIIRQESPAIQRNLARRIANYSKQDATGQLLKDLKRHAKTLITPIANDMKRACSGITDLELATPVALIDMIFPSGFKAQIGEGMQVDDSVLGAGAQSLLMFHVLHLIDQSEFQNFGWRQAAVWAVEEPESSLHRELEVRLAALFRDYAERADSRFQIFSTTHSDVFVFAASSGFFVTVDGDSSAARPRPVDELAHEASAAQISSWSQPALKYCLDPLVVVEGDIDVDVLGRAAQLLRICAGIKFVTASRLDPSLGGDGVESIERFVKSHSAAINLRLPRYPLLAMFDWDVSDQKVSSTGTKYGSKGASRVLKMRKEEASASVGESFRGIERFYHPDFLKRARDKGVLNLAETKEGQFVVDPKDLSQSKSQLASLFLAEGTVADAAHFRGTLERLATLVDAS